MADSGEPRAGGGSSPLKDAQFPAKHLGRGDGTCAGRFGGAAIGETLGALLTGAETGFREMA